MDRLWSPWRLAYVTGGTSTASCIFCEAGEAGADAPLVLHRGTHAFVILNLFPYNNGHLMIVPRRHIATLAEATPDELQELIALTRQAEIVLTEAYAPHGLNVGLNLGKAAGAGVADHLHIHVVPRWNGDTNFMPVIADIKVMPEHLDTVYRQLKEAVEKVIAASS